MKNILLILCLFLAACHAEPKPKPKPTTSVFEFLIRLGDDKEPEDPCKIPEYIEPLENDGVWDKMEYYKKFNTLTLEGEPYIGTHILAPYVRILTNKKVQDITQIGCPTRCRGEFKYFKDGTRYLVKFQKGEPHIGDDKYTFFIYLKNKRYALRFYQATRTSPINLIWATERRIEGNLVKSKIWGEEDGYESIQKKITYPIKNLSFIPLLPSNNYETEIDSLSHFESDSCYLCRM